MIGLIRKAGEVSLDTETTSLSPVEAELVGMSFSIKEREGWYLPLLSRGMFSEEYLDPAQSLALLKPLLTDPSVKKIGQNIKYDLLVLMNYGIELAGHLIRHHGRVLPAVARTSAATTWTTWRKST